MVFQRPENDDFGHFIHIVCYIAGKSENVKFLVVLICHFYHVVMLFRMLLVGPTLYWDWGRRDGGLPAA